LLRNLFLSARASPSIGEGLEQVVITIYEELGQKTSRARWITAKPLTTGRIGVFHEGMNIGAHDAFQSSFAPESGASASILPNFGCSRGSVRA